MTVQLASFSTELFRKLPGGVLNPVGALGTRMARTTYIEFTMTIFGQCLYVLNNNA